MDDQKRGPWSSDEKIFIADNYRKMTFVEIAKVLKRNPAAVNRYIETQFYTKFQQTATNAEYNITASPLWKDIEKQFTPEELSIFLYHWGRMISQFRDDVLPTEELQVIDTIKLDILMNRCLSRQQHFESQIRNLQNRVDMEYDKPESDRDRNMMQGLQNQISIMTSALSSLNGDYKEMLNRKNAILKEMKATRDSRIKNIESSKESFGGWVKNVFANKETRDTIGREMEKMRLAMQVEYEKLSEYHEYIDGMVDQPILDANNVLE